MNQIALPSRTMISETILLLLFGCISALGYTNLGNNVFMSNGSSTDTQAAINAAPPGSTIQIANGSYTWTSGITISTPIILEGQSLNGVTITNNVSASGADAIDVNPAINGNAQIAQLHMIGGSGTGHHITVSYTSGGRPVLIHDCYFDVQAGHSTVRGALEWQINGGVIWNCTFNAHDQDGSFIQFYDSQNNTNAWAHVSTMGMADTNGTANTYIEDCTFNNCLYQALDPGDNAKIVVRHCKFNNTGCSSHGADTQSYGARHWEWYNNTYLFSTSGTSPDGNTYPLNINWWHLFRGGTGVIFNNVMPDLSSQQWGNKSSLLFAIWNIRRASTDHGCQTTYPAFHQIAGSADANGKLFIDPIYIWGNTGGTRWMTSDTDDWETDECGNGQTMVPKYWQRNRDYFIGTPKPGYTPYTYPHPLRAGGLSGPPAPQNLRVEK